MTAAPRAGWGGGLGCTLGWGRSWEEEERKVLNTMPKCVSEKPARAGGSPGMLV